MGVSINHDRRRAEFTAEPGFSGTVLSRAVAAMFDADPRTASYDLIFDVRGSDTGATQADLDLVAAAYHRHERTPGVKYGCFVTTDPNYPLWTAAMDHQFSDRKNKVFVTVENARAFLDRARA
jgi:metal-dependent hydrolase (beta-lactamase superfamily II)